MSLYLKYVMPALMEFAEDIIMCDDDNSSFVDKIWGYAEVTVPNFEHYQFKRHFRMSPVTFETLLQQLHHVVNRNRTGHPELPLKKQLMITIWYLANIESFRSVSERFGISKSTAWTIVIRICRTILEFNKVYKVLWWPTLEKQQKISDSFRAVSGIPGVIGCIDGSHIRITKPTEHGNSYINRKGYPSIVLQAVCLKTLLFTDVHAGQPGSMHDERVYQKSDLGESINAGLVEFIPNSHLVGDLAYKLSQTMLVGCKNTGHLSERQKMFNQKLSKTRVVIENSFALLKGRFRRLKFMETVRLDLITVLTVSACILHNVCLLDGDYGKDIVDIQTELQEREGNDCVRNDDYCRDAAIAVAVRKRNDIVNSLPI